MLGITVVFFASGKNTDLSINGFKIKDFLSAQRNEVKMCRSLTVLTKHSFVVKISVKILYPILLSVPYSLHDQRGHFS